MSRAPDDTTRGFRPSARRRNRIAAGIALGAVAIGGNVLVYSSLDDSTTVVQALRDIPAGAEITPDMLRVVEVDLDDSVQAVPGDQLALIPGQYAKVRIVSGSLVVAPALQSTPLVAPGSAIVAIEVPRALVPVGVRERSRVELVYEDGSGDEVVVPGETIGFPTDTANSGGAVSLTVQVPETSASGVAVADDVRIVLLAPPDGAN